MPIRRLPPHVVNQIAAGEVVERPASVVKELLENSLDAGATRIEVSIEGGGLERIEVADDGAGIAAEELPLAVAPHATSKISDAADLEQVATLGFRGEALASIASVSAFSIRSRRREDASGAIVEVEGGEAGGVRPAAGAPGTTVTVRHLFMNAPARRKFLKTPATETARAVEVVRTAAIARPDVAFRVVVDGRVTLDLPAIAWRACSARKSARGCCPSRATPGSFLGRGASWVVPISRGRRAGASASTSMGDRSRTASWSTRSARDSAGRCRAIATRSRSSSSTSRRATWT
jgi:DNA mismatch repair protein MutL